MWACVCQMSVSVSGLRNPIAEQGRNSPEKWWAKKVVTDQIEQEQAAMEILPPTMEEETEETDLVLRNSDGKRVGPSGRKWGRPTRAEQLAKGGFVASWFTGAMEKERGLFFLMHKDPKVAFAAYRLLMAYAHGKPQGSVELSGDPDRPLEIVISYGGRKD